MRWLNEPPAWTEEDGALRLTTAPDTDFWRTTHYGFVRDTGQFRHRRVSGDFTARVRVEGAYREQYDQAGLMLRLDERTWLKCGIEYVDGRQWASAVITRELSDWSVVALEPEPAGLWVEVRRTAEAVQVSFGESAPRPPAPPRSADGRRGARRRRDGGLAGRQRLRGRAARLRRRAGLKGGGQAAGAAVRAAPSWIAASAWACAAVAG